ncbi:hypothetical protein GCM10020220_015140 [Nonomuraea rubra]
MTGSVSTPLSASTPPNSQISVTMNVYTQIPSPETRKALDRLNDRLANGDQGQDQAS